MARRQATWGRSYAEDGSIPRPVLLFQELVHIPGVYDLEVDTSVMSPEASAEAIRVRMDEGPAPTSLQRLAAA